MTEEIVIITEDGRKGNNDRNLSKLTTQAT